MNRRLIGFLLILIFISGIVPATSQERAVIQSEAAQAAWSEDVGTLARQMEARHPDLYYRVSEADFQRAVDQLDADIPYLTDDQIIVRIMSIVALIDGHTFIPPFQPATGFQLYPLRLYGFSDGLFVVAAQEPYQDAVGQWVVSVGGMAVEQVAALLAPTIHHDNENTIRLMLPVRFLIPEMLHALDVIEAVDQPAIVLENQDGSRTTINPPPITAEAYRDWDGGYHDQHPMARQLGAYEEIILLAGLMQQPEPLYLSRRYDDFFWLTLLDDSNTLYIQYNMVQPRNPDRTTIARFTADLRDFVETHDQIEKIVLDLRHNPGGESGQDNMLEALLTTHATINQPDKFFVLIGRQTFSAAVMLLTNLEQNSAAIFIGEATGGAPHIYGDARRLVLPNSGLEVHIASRYYETTSPDDARVQIEPHIRVDLSSGDYFSGHDPVLQAVLDFESE